MSPLSYSCHWKVSLTKCGKIYGKIVNKNLVKLIVFDEVHYITMYGQSFQLAYYCNVRRLVQMFWCNSTFLFISATLNSTVLFHISMMLHPQSPWRNKKFISCQLCTGLSLHYSTNCNPSFLCTIAHQVKQCFLFCQHIAKKHSNCFFLCDSLLFSLLYLEDKEVIKRQDNKNSFSN